MLPQKAVDEFKALMEAEYGIELSDEEAREQAGRVLTVMKHAFVQTEPSVVIDKTDLTL